MKILLPSMNEQLTFEEFQRACALIDYYFEEGSNIRPYCEERGRNPDLYDRGNVWEGGFLDLLMKSVLNKEYNNINRLRLIGWHFSAYRLFDLASVVEPPTDEFMIKFFSGEIETLPDDVDKIILDAIDPEARMNLIMPRLQFLESIIQPQNLVGQPARLGEVGGKLGDLWVNGDSVRYWGAIAFFERSGILAFVEHQIATRGIARILEIGSGYGGLGYHLKSIFGNKLQFICVDLVESLIFSSIYLNILFDDDYLLYKNEAIINESYKTVFVPSFRSPEFFEAVGELDLCINTVSMNEMSAQQVDYYARCISRRLTPGAAFFEVNWKAALAGPDRIDCKSFIALHFAERMSIENTEVANDGNLDLWSNDIADSIVSACRRTYAGQVEDFTAQ